MKKFLFLALGVLSFGFMGTAQAADIGVFREGNDTLRTVDIDGNTVVSRAELSSQEASVLGGFTVGTDDDGLTTIEPDENRWSGDFFTSTDGFELLTVVSGRVEIENANNNDEVDSFKVSNKNAEMVIAVGDVLPDIDGQEVVVCQRDSNPSRLRIYSYDESTGTATKQLSFIPFNEEGATGGCGDVQVGDIDDDGTTDILVTKYSNNTSASTISLFSPEGDLVSTIDLDLTPYNSSYLSGVVHFDLLDFDGDGIRDEMAVSYYGAVYIHTVDGAFITSTDLRDAYYKSYAIGNVDEDVADEIVIMTGKKCKLTIWEESGSTVIGQAFSSASKNRERTVVIGDLSSFVD